jgi:hypothetical protein
VVEHRCLVTDSQARGKLFHELVKSGDHVRIVSENDGFGCLCEDFETGEPRFIRERLAGDELAVGVDAYSPPIVVQASTCQAKVCKQASRVPTEQPGGQPQFDVRHGLPRYTSPAQWQFDPHLPRGAGRTLGLCPLSTYRCITGVGRLTGPLRMLMISRSIWRSSRISF